MIYQVYTIVLCYYSRKETAAAAVSTRNNNPRDKISRPTEQQIAFALSIISSRKLRKSFIFPFFILFRPIIFHAISICDLAVVRPSCRRSVGIPGPVQLRWWQSTGNDAGFCRYMIASSHRKIISQSVRGSSATYPTSL